MALRLTKTSKIIFAIVIVVLSGALGYLIWRVNQPETVAPEESEAGSGGDGGGCCLPVLVNGVLTCPYGSGSTACKNGSTCCGATEGLNCGADTFCTGPIQYLDCDPLTGLYSSCQTVNTSGFLGYPDQCGDCTDSELGEDECHTGSDCEPCAFPNVAFCVADGSGVTSCECASWETSIGDTVGGGIITLPCVSEGDTFTCEAVCPSGTEECEYGETGCTSYREECSCPVCNNPTFDLISCKTAVVAENVCDSGSTWVTRPTGSIDFDNDITFSATATDSDGISGTSITAKLCTGTVTTCTSGEDISVNLGTVTTTSTTFSGVLSSATDRLTPGTYTLTLSWADSLGATSASCTLTTTFTMLEEETNPDWDIDKEVVEVCIDENTDNPKSELSYTITVTNTGDGVGSISKIEDDLDSKVLAGFVQSGITSPGVYSNGTIVWDYTSSPLEIASGASEVYTYQLVIDKDSFGTYSNTVTLTPVGSDSIQATASIPADCEITPTDEPDVPQTGIFDTTLGRIVFGFTLILFGAIVYSIPNGIFRRETSYKYRDKFEGRVVKKD